MTMLKIPSSQFYFPYRISLFSYKSIVTLLLITNFIFACAETKMSVEEAKQVTVSMSDKPFIPPPRRIDDILKFLDQPGQYKSEDTESLKSQVIEIPPENADPSFLAQFYRRRGLAAYMLGYMKQGIEDLRKAYNLDSSDGNIDERIVFRLAIFERHVGNYNRGIELLKQQVRRSPTSACYFHIVMFYAAIGDFEAAERLRIEGIAFIRSILMRSKMSKRIPWLKFHMAGIESAILTAQGKYAQAEPYLREQLLQMLKVKKDRPDMALYWRLSLASNLRRQRRLIEAEIEIRKVIKESIELGGKNSRTTARALTSLAHNLLAQGRPQEAKRILDASIQLLKNLDIPPRSLDSCHTKNSHGIILTILGEYQKAMDEFDFLRERLADDPYIYEMLYHRNLTVMLALVMTGRYDEAIDLLSDSYKLSRKYLGQRHFRVAQILALRGLANYKKGKLELALPDFLDSIPMILKIDLGMDGGKGTSVTFGHLRGNSSTTI